MPVKIAVENVTKSYVNGKRTLPVIAGVDFAVGEGEFLAMVGPSGCGKTTLLNMIAGFEQPDAGRITIDGAPRGRPGPKGIVISQQGSVFPWLTVRQNLLFGLDGRDDRQELADHYIALVGLKDFAGAYPHELSGGMLKRVEVARALAVKPEILYMDEPLSALDALTSLRMRIETLRILEEERHTCLLVTHNVDEAVHMADRVFVLSARPATIQATFELPFPHPRRLASPELQSIREAILRELGI